MIVVLYCIPVSWFASATSNLQHSMNHAPTPISGCRYAYVIGDRWQYDRFYLFTSSVRDGMRVRRPPDFPHAHHAVMLIGTAPTVRTGKPTKVRLAVRTRTVAPSCSMFARRSRDF